MGAIPLSEVGKAIVYDAPSHSTHVAQIKKASYMKGEYPEHLKAYAANKTGLNKCPVECKGKTGLAYSACLRKCAERLGIKKRK
ncbi:MAG: hypothetical protein ACTSX6_00460 [Candidatus Heimdallarchaeaceae archaeon]